MGIVFRQSVKSSIVTFAGAVLGAAVIYLSTYFLPKQEFGFRSTLTNYAVVGGQILLVGLHNTIAVYIHRYNSSDKRSAALLSISFVLPFIFIAIAAAGYFIFKETIINLFQEEDIPFIRQYFLWLPVFTLLFAYQVLLETYLISQLKVAKATFVREVLLRLMNILLIVLFGLGWISYALLIYSTVLIYLIPIGILLSISINTNQFTFSADWGIFKSSERKELADFTWYHSLLGVTITLMGMLDALMVATLSPNGLKAVPVYTISVFIISFLLIPYRAMLNSTFALLARTFKSNDQNNIQDIFMRSSLNIFIASVGMYLIIVCNLHNAVKLLPEGYSGIVPVVIILATGRMADMVTGMNDQVLSLSSHYRYNFVISLLLVFLIVLLNWWLIPLYDVTGAAWATTIALIVYNAIKLFVVKYTLGLQPVNNKTALVFLSGTAALAVGYLLPEMSGPVLDTGYRSIITLMVYFVLLITLKPSDDLSVYWESIRKNKKLF